MTRRLVVAALGALALAALAAVVIIGREDTAAPAPGAPQGSVAGRLPDGYCAVAPDASGERGEAARSLARRWNAGGRIVFVALPCGADDRASIAGGARVFVRILVDRTTGEPMVFDGPEELGDWVRANQGDGAGIGQDTASDDGGIMAFPAVETGSYMLLPRTLDLPATADLPTRRATVVDGYRLSGDLPVHVRFERETIGEGVISSLLRDAHTLMESLEVRLER